MGISPEHCIVLEDSVNGIVAAHNGGMMPVMVIDLILPEKYCYTHCKWIVDNLHQIIEKLENQI